MRSHCLYLSCVCYHVGLPFLGDGALCHAAAARLAQSKSPLRCSCPQPPARLTPTPLPPRSALLDINGQIFQEQARALNEVASRDCKVRAAMCCCGQAVGRL